MALQEDDEDMPSPMYHMLANGPVPCKLKMYFIHAEAAESSMQDEGQKLLRASWQRMHVSWLVSLVR